MLLNNKIKILISFTIFYSPFYTGFIWEVTSNDLDRFMKKIMEDLLIKKSN